MTPETIATYLCAFGGIVMLINATIVSTNSYLIFAIGKLIPAATGALLLWLSAALYLQQIGG